MGFKTRIFLITAWANAFGYMESVVVLYLRKIYYPFGFSFPLLPIDEKILIAETAREAATLVLIFTTAAFAYRRFQSRVAAFFMLFGIWDISYYIYLKVLLDWPASLFTWDILFLIPIPWVGPVWAPIAVSLGLVFFSFLILLANEKGKTVNFGPVSVSIAIAAAAIIVISFMIPGLSVMENGMPGTFPEALFWGGFILGISAYTYAIYTSLRNTRSLHTKKL